MAYHHEGFEVVEGQDGEWVWVLVPAHSDENRALALDEAEWHCDNRYEQAEACWAVDHACPDDCDDCEKHCYEVASEYEERGEDVPDDAPHCFCHGFEGSGMAMLPEYREGARAAYEIVDARA